MNQIDMEDDEDTHICLRCRTTIVGLDEYVAHRKTPGLCPAKSDVGRKSPVITPLSPDWPKSPDADDFFMSLELQSASNVRKSNLASVSTPLSLSSTPNVAESSDDEAEDYRGLIPSRTTSGGKWRPEDIPPTNYTGGKWLPSTTSLSTTDQQYSEEEGSGTELESSTYHHGPPPSHTGGKWVPGSGEYGGANSTLRISGGGTVQYWCGSCNRRLSSRALYDKHLLSDLHARRTRDPDEDKWNVNNRKNVRRSSRKIVNKKTLVSCFKMEEITPSKTSLGQAKRYRRKRLRCGVCRARVWSHLVGKHLVSHYHWRAARSLSQGDAHHSLLLDYIHEIVRQAPFQCAPCHFYCNLPSEFRNHWNSETHRKQHNKGEGDYFCSFCRFSTSTLEEVTKHLLSNDHRDLIRTVNGSVPIIIERRLPITCFTCKQAFRYNAELRHHSKLIGHKILPQSTASDIYQDNRKSKPKLNSSKSKTCNLCQATLPNVDAYKLHLSQTHADLPAHRCIKCGLTFSLSQQLTHHARSGSCNSRSELITQSCPTGINNSDKRQINKNICTLCQFEARSIAEIIYHNTVVHPINTYSNKKEDKWECPLCNKNFRSKLLEAHIRTHTGEKPFMCYYCSRAFGYRSSLVSHLKVAHGKEINSSETNTKKITKKSNLQRKESNSNVSTKTSLKKHRNIKEIQNKLKIKEIPQLALHQREKPSHQKPRSSSASSKPFPCTWPECALECRSQAELRAHERTHTQERPFACDKCSYHGRTKQQLMRHMGVHGNSRPHQCSLCNFASRFRSHLVRHMRIHTGSKPYRCPYCTYECNMLENLRKHVLVTGKHPGKRMYECSFCSGETIFSTDLARDFQSHLQNQHETRFSTHAEAMAYVAAYHMPERRSTMSTLSGKRDDWPQDDDEDGPEEMTLVLDPAENMKIFIDMPDSDLEESGNPTERIPN